VRIDIPKKQRRSSITKIKVSESQKVHLLALHLKLRFLFLNEFSCKLHVYVNLKLGRSYSPVGANTWRLERT